MSFSRLSTITFLTLLRFAPEVRLSHSADVFVFLVRPPSSGYKIGLLKTRIGADPSF